MRELAEEAAHVGWLHHEVGTNEVSLSDALQRRFGLGKSAGVEELLARVVAPEAQQVLELWQPTRDMQPMQFCVRFAQDELGYVYVMPRAVMNDDVAVAVVAVVIDVSERVMLERQLQQTQKMTALGELAASVAHDINNTLMVIMCAAECLEVASTEAEEVSDIKRATESAAGLTRRLLLFSRQSALDPRSVDVGETLAETLVLVRRTIGDIVTVEEKLADAPPVHVDPVQLGRRGVQRIAVQ